MKADPYRPKPDVGTMDHLRREVARHDIDRVVLVQTGSAYRWNSRLLAHIAREHADWLVGVCTLNPCCKESPSELEKLVEEYNVKGVRIEVGDGHFRHLGSERLWKAAERLGAVVCAPLRSDHLHELDEMIALFPTMPVVLDHCAYPHVDEGTDGGTLSCVG